MTTNLDLIRGRQVVQTLTNQSGGAVIAGDVVIVDTANDESFTTTTSAAYNSTRIGVALDSIAAAGTGRILLQGYAPLVNVSASATRGHYLFTHTVAKQAATSATYAAGAFGQIIKAGTTPSAVIFPVAQVGSAGIARSGATTDAHLAVWNGSNADSLKDGGAVGSGGAATTDHFVTTAAETDLSAEVAIPGLAGSADILGAGGAGTSEEYDTATTGLTWTSAPTVVDSNTTIKSHLYVKDANAATTYGYKAWSPAGAFDARCKVSCGADQVGNSHEMSFWVGDSGTPITNGLCIIFQGSGTNTLQALAFTVASTTFTQRGSTIAIGAEPIYLRITRDGSNNCSFYYSYSGLLWHFIVTQALTFTAARIGFRISSGSAVAHYGACDWLRTDV